MREKEASFTGRAAMRVPGAGARAQHLRQTMTLPEKMLWADLRKLDLGFRRQGPIGRYVADFVCHSAKLVVEVDSERHDLPESQLPDAERTAWLETQGYQVVRFRNGEMANDRGRVVGDIVAIICERSPGLRKKLQEARQAPFPLNGGRAGDGGAVHDRTGLLWEAFAPPAFHPEAVSCSPPSPTLPPSRGKGEAP